jgi:hypothetical protein
MCANAKRIGAEMSIILRIVLALCGMGIVALGLNVSLGGIVTLGWQGSTDFVSVTDAAAFTVQDNHTRFIAGVWTGVGLAFLAGAIAPVRMRPILLACIAMIVVGAFARITSGDWDLLTSSAILPSLLAELLVFPAIGFWILRDARSSNA